MDIHDLLPLGDLDTFHVGVERPDRQCSTVHVEDQYASHRRHQVCRCYEPRLAYACVAVDESVYARSHVADTLERNASQATYGSRSQVCDRIKAHLSPHVEVEIVIFVGRCAPKLTAANAHLTE